MPYVSRQQQKAMYAAKAGRSTLGIPQRVGAEFVKAGPASSKLPKRAPKKAASRKAPLKKRAKGNALQRFVKSRTASKRSVAPKRRASSKKRPMGRALSRRR